ncbi:GGDEF domain-containing protein [Lactiplantibacillus mudanjiangensis]|uniref:GGDEF domain-containing protein [Lactobacillus sp.] n=1 Tax=Lactiplantibacillus mudanjiangensis TaxID=1296538 RepID=A0A660E4M1_9LACO|nr:GGDEF domain-containing protein [Lactiplantibacillus mudanjiangensis]VDG20147.1 GGDEF domain-containing protein [Lactobacillus sp.] [Lactiplantibacillus mudanjiangensis]VDG23844.1 GGDEF domain-containing protein [Lactobacillus sp.] [Lactiplantibacillus mudanjiangensis]VDG30338.1 GGDEF domain-containing protein [Lactobacillus sp.] [Lactiplantibacillus mudanjiangensis]VDG33542.1 GGDEF domain-containing protein [Lactobacillus sp.] [Lactiplantibacillus mudanjiangensis]
MTWSYWRVPPFVTSIFFILGVLTLYWVLFNWITSWVHNRHINIDDDVINSWHGVLYMLVFVFSMQSMIVGQNDAWQFMNFQVIAMIFCAYFLNIHIPYYLFFPVVLVYMIFNQSIGYWQSWGHAITLVLFFWVLNYVRIHFQNHKLAPLIYMSVGIPFAGVLWLWMKVKFNLPWDTYWQEWVYLVIFEVLLYVYVTMLTKDSEFKLRLAQFASHDALTQAENFAAYTGEIKFLFEDSSRNNLKLSMMMFDIDHFKHVNDTYGHLAGDRVLQHATDVVQTVINANDTKVKLYRTGGEEFNILFPGYDVESTQTIVRQIFIALNHLAVNFGDQQIPISISVGVSAMSKDDLSPTDFYNRVDHNLYHSKRNGRMRITVS